MDYITQPITVRQTIDFADWLRKLRDKNAHARIQIRIRRLALGNFGDVKSAGDGVSEAPINYDPGAIGYSSASVAMRQSCCRVAATKAAKRTISSEQKPSRWKAIHDSRDQPWDPTKHLDTAEATPAYVEAAFEDGDPALIAAVIGDVARARGMTQLAREAGVSRETLYKAFGEGGNPTLETLSGVIKALGLKMTVRAA